MRCLTLFLLACLSTAVRAQIASPPPDTLLDAGHCLAADQRDWLDVASERPYEVELGFISPDNPDSGKSDSAKDPLYLIEFTTATHTEGFAFVFLSRGKDPHRDLLLQFRTRFHQTDDGSQQVKLVDPPLGGVGTQDDILAAIRQVGFHTWKVPVDSLRKRASSVHCATGEGLM